jgi:hypothetical protein
MLKKLKLALLATSVMFFPKGIYAADKDKDELRTLVLRPASSDGRLAHSLLPVFPNEQDVEGQPFVGPSSSQVSAASSSSGANFTLDQFPGGLTIRGRALYAEVLQSSIETNIDLKKIFNFNDIQECKEAEESISVITQFLNKEAQKPLKEIEKTLEELEDQFRAQLKAQFKEGLERASESLGFTIRLFDLNWASSDKKIKKATKKILSSYSTMLKDLPLYIELFQQKKHADDFIDKVYDKIDEPEGFTEAALVDILKEIPENSRNLIERMAGPFFKMSNLSKFQEQIPPIPEEERDPKKAALVDMLIKSKGGLSLYNDLWRNNIGTHVDLTKYFNLNDVQERQEARKTSLIVFKLLKTKMKEPLEELEKKQQEVEKKIIESEGQEDLYLAAQNQLEGILDDEVSIEDFFLSCCTLLEDPKFQGSELSLYIDLIQQSKFFGDYFERVRRVKNFTEATLEDILKEIPEKARSSRNLIERVGRPFLKMKSLKKSMKQALPPEDDHSDLISEAADAPIESVAVPSQPIEALASTSQAPFSSSNSSRGLVKATFRTAGANEAAEIKHSAIYASFSYQNNPDAAYSLIINHRTKNKGSMVRVHNPNARAYINLGRLSPSVSFSNEVFDLSFLFEGVPSSSSSASIMRTELNFIDGISDIHSFKVKSDGQTLIKVTLGDERSEKQTGVYVYAPEVAEKLQEWSEVRSEDVQS